MTIKKDYILILSDEIRPMNSDYIEEMVGHLKREGIGAVGGKLYLKNGKIESAGYTRDENGKLVSDFAGLNKHFSGYLHRASLQRRVDAVAVECMMVKKAAVTVDKSLKDEYAVVYTPYAEFKRK